MSIGLIKKVNQFHPFIFNWKSIAVPSIATFALMLFFKPISSDNQELLFSYLLGLYSSIITAITIFSVTKIVQSNVQVNRWTVGKEILLILGVVFFIAVFHYFLFIAIKAPENGYWIYFSDVVLKTFIISIFPVILMVLYEQYNYSKNQLKQVIELNSTLKFKIKEHQSSELKLPIRLFAENNKLMLQVNIEQVGFLKSEGNYVEVFYLDSSQTVKKVLIRNKLKVLEKQLNSQLMLIVHKSYLVNISLITEVKGNSRAMEVYLSDFNIWIPVSRSNTAELQSRLVS